jgi:hypothetical protein
MQTYFVGYDGNEQRAKANDNVTNKDTTNIHLGTHSTPHIVSRYDPLQFSKTGSAEYPSLDLTN